MPTQPYRFRRCPQCRATFAAGELRPLRLGGGHWHQRGGSLRRCPECGYVAFTQRFGVVGNMERIRYSALN
jgi:hypothetical protein